MIAKDDLTSSQCRTRRTGSLARGGRGTALNKDAIDAIP